MAIPVMLYAFSATQALPIAAVLVVRGRHAPAPLLRVSVWFLVLILADMLDLYVAYRHGTNRGTSWLMLPIEVAATFWILEAWQVWPIARRVYRLAVPIVLGGAALALMALDPDRTFEIIVGPILALSALGATIQTWVQRSLATEEPLLRQDWFWILLGVGLLWLSFVPSSGFIEVFLQRGRVGEAIIALLSRSWIAWASILLVTWGIVCPRVLRP